MASGWWLTSLSFPRDFVLVSSTVMPFGILDDHKLDSVPGTGLLSAGVNRATIEDAKELKRGSGKHSHIVLIPQPSDDPRDPLNWPRWKKEACFWTLIFTTSLEGALYSLASPGYVLLAKEFNVSVDEIASTFSAAILGLAIFTLFQNALAFKYGYRLVFLLSTFLIFICCVWTAMSPNLASIRASRVFQGFGMAAPRALVPTAIEHIFFVHERGSRSIVWSFCVGSGTTLGPFIYGYVAQYLSWRLGFWFVSVACGLSFLGVFFFVRETTYHRRAATIHPIKSNEDMGDGGKDGMEKKNPTPDTPIADIQYLDPNAPCPKPPSFLRQFKIYNGTFSDDSLWKIFLRQFPFILSPVMWFLLLTASLSSAWFSLVSVCLTTIFTTTYHFNAAQVGLTHLAGLVGVILAMSTTFFYDRAIVWMSRRNRGIHEPEYRLIFTLNMLFSVVAYVCWGIGNDHHMPWIGATICFAILSFSMTVTTGTALTYLLDTHGANALYILSLLNIARELVFYGATFFANGFILSRGVKVSLLILGGLEAVCWLPSVPIYVYGKRVRSFIARHPQLFRGDLPEDDRLPRASTSETRESKC